MLTVSDDTRVVDEDGNILIADRGYRVLLVCDDGERFIVAAQADRWAFRFARPRDAEAAIAALERAGLTTHDAMLEAGWPRIREVMLEAMQW